MPRLVTFDELQQQFSKLSETRNITPEDVIALLGPPQERVDFAERVVLIWNGKRCSGLDWAESEYVIFVPTPVAYEGAHYCIYLGGPGNRYIGGWKIWKNALIQSLTLTKSFLKPADLHDWPGAYELQYPVRR